MHRVLMIAVLLVLAGCSFGPVATPTINTYSLEAPSAVSKASKRHDQTLLVLPTAVAPGLQTRRMLYVTKPHQINAFAQNQWQAPPAAMINNALVQVLRASHAYHAVVTPPFSGESQLRLQTKLIELEQNFMVQPSQVSLVVAAQMIDRTNKVITSVQYAQQTAAPEETPYGGVIAANQALQIVLAKLLRMMS